MAFLYGMVRAVCLRFARMTVGVYNVGEIKVHGDDKIEAHGDGR